MTNWPTQERDRSHKTQVSKDKTTDQDPKATPDMENKTEVTHKTEEISRTEVTHRTEEISRTETTHGTGATPNQETTLDPTKATTKTGHKAMSNLKTEEEDHKRMKMECKKGHRYKVNKRNHMNSNSIFKNTLKNT